MNEHSLNSNERPNEECLPFVWLTTEPDGLSDTARKRRDEIMDSAEAIITEQGIDELSLAKIEQRAGMSRGQLTYYFPTRELILLAVYDRMLRRMIRSMMASDGPKPMTGQAWNCLHFALDHHVNANWTERNKELFSLLFTFLARVSHRADYREKLSQMYRGWREQITADITTSVNPPYAVEPRILASVIQAMIQGLEIQLTIDPTAFDPAAMIDACRKMLAPLFKQPEHQGNGTHAAPATNIPHGSD